MIAGQAEGTASPPRPHVTRRDIGWSALLALVLNAPALVHKDALNSDEATIGTIARMIRHGAGLYVGAVDRKPPGAFMLFRVLEPVFGGWTFVAARVVAMTCTVIAMWVIALEAKRRWPTVDARAVALLGIVAFALLPAEDSRSVGFELLATLPAVAAFVLGARRRTLLAGVALGVAALFKQPMLLGALPLAVQCLTVAESWSRRVVRLAIAGVACAATVVAGLAPFGLSDALSWFSGSGDNYLGGLDTVSVIGVGLRQIGELLAMIMGLLILAHIPWHRKPRSIPLDLAAWLVAGALASAIGLRFIFHYFNQLMPALVLLAAAAASGRVALRSKLFRFGLVWLGGAALYSFVTVLIPSTIHDLPDVDRIAAAIDRRTSPGEKIFVWGQAPEIYWVSDRDPATRYPHVGFVTGITPNRPGLPAYVLSQAGAAQNLLHDLQTNHPAVVVDAAIESIRGGDRYPLGTSPIAAFVAANYCEAEVVDGMRLLVPCTP